MVCLFDVLVQKNPDCYKKEMPCYAESLRCQCFICHLTGHADQYWLGLDQENPLQVKLAGLMLIRRLTVVHRVMLDAFQSYFFAGCGIGMWSFSQHHKNDIFSLETMFPDSKKRKKKTVGKFNNMLYT